MMINKVYETPFHTDTFFGSHHHTGYPHRKCKIGTTTVYIDLKKALYETQNDDFFSICDR